MICKNIGSMSAWSKNPEFAKWLADWLSHSKEDREPSGNISPEGTNTTDNDVEAPGDIGESDGSKPKAA